MDGKGKTMLFCYCKVTKMSFLEEKIKLKKTSFKMVSFHFQSRKPLLRRALSFIVESKSTPSSPVFFLPPPIILDNPQLENGQ